MLREDEAIDQIRNERAALDAGKDPLRADDGSNLFSPDMVRSQQLRYLGEREAKLQQVLADLGPEIDELRSKWRGYVDTFKSLNQEPLAAMQTDPTASQRRIEPVRLLQSELSGLTDRVTKLHKAMRSIDPSFSAYHHPATADFARGLSPTGANTVEDLMEMEGYEEETGLAHPGKYVPRETASIFDPQADYDAGVLGNLAVVGLKGADAALEGLARVATGKVPGLDVSAAQAVSRFGEWVVGGLAGDAGVNWMKAKLGWDSSMMTVPTDYIRDENGRPLAVAGRIGIPELLGPLAGRMLGTEAAAFTRNAREAEQLWNEVNRGKLWGIAGDVGAFMGGLAGLTKATAPFTNTLLAGRAATARGLSMVGLTASASPKVKRIANVLIAAGADAAVNGGYEMMATGHLESASSSFLRGASMGTALHALGGMANKAEQLLLRKKMPGFLAQQIGAGLEGAGMAAYGVVLPGEPKVAGEGFGSSSLGQGLWKFLKDPTTANWHRFQEEMTINVSGMMLYKGLFGRHARRGNLVEAFQGPQQRAAEDLEFQRQKELKVLRKDLGREKALVSLEELSKFPELQEEIGFTRYAEELKPLVTQIKKSGKIQAGLEVRKGQPESLDVPGSLSGLGVSQDAETGTYEIDMPENLAERLIRSAQRFTGTRADRPMNEWGGTGTFLGGKMFFSPQRGKRAGEGGPSVDLSISSKSLADKMVKLGHSRADVEEQQAKGNLFTFHHHPGGGTFSDADLNVWIKRFWQREPGTVLGGNVPHMVFTDQGMWVATPGETTLRGDAMAPQRTETAEAITRTTKEVHARLAAGDVAWVRNTVAGKSLTEGEMAIVQAAAKEGFDAFFEKTKQHAETYFHSKKGTPEERALGKLGNVVIRAIDTQRALRGVGAELHYFNAREARDAWARYAETGDIRALGGQQVTPEANELAKGNLRESFRREVGVKPRLAGHIEADITHARDTATSSFHDMIDRMAARWADQSGKTRDEALAFVKDVFAGKRGPGGMDAQTDIRRFLNEVGSKIGEHDMGTTLVKTPRMALAVARAMGIDFKGIEPHGEFRERGPMVDPSLGLQFKEPGGDAWIRSDIFKRVAPEFREALADRLEGILRDDRVSTTEAVLEWAREQTGDPYTLEFSGEDDGGRAGLKVTKSAPLQQDTLDLAQGVLDQLYGTESPDLPQAGSATARDFEPGSTKPPSDADLSQARRVEEQLTTAEFGEDDRAKIDKEARAMGLDPKNLTEGQVLEVLRRIDEREAGTVREPARDLPMAEQQKILDTMFKMESELTKPATPMFHRLKTMAAATSRKIGQFFTDSEFRERVAARVEKLGYRARFTAMKEDEPLVLAETDRVRKNIIEAPRLSMGDMSHIYEPIANAEGKDSKQRQELLRQTQEYALLRDLRANYLRTKEIEGQTVEFETKLPFGVSIEAIQNRLASLEASLSPEQRESYSRMRTLLDQAFDSMKRRGLVTEQSRQVDYYPRNVVDWTDVSDVLNARGPMNKGPKEPFRGYLLGRKGTERALSARLEDLHAYLAKVRIDNSIHDYLTTIGSGVQDRLFGKHGLDQTTIDDMNLAQWRGVYDQLEKQGLVVLDVKKGRIGKQTLERDPAFQEIMVEIAQITGEFLPEAEIGRFFKPDPAAGRYLVTKDLLEFTREMRKSSQWFQNPALNLARRMIGKWFKGPALRGLLGVRLPERISRNLFSDTTGIVLKSGDEGSLGGMRALRETMKQYPMAHRLVMASIDPKRLEKLTPLEKSLHAEWQYHGTGKTGFWTSETEFAREQKEGEFLKRFMPEVFAWQANLSKWIRADFEWAQKLDDYSENILRAAYFLRERFARYQRISDDPDLTKDAERLAAVRAAHIKTGEVFVNYQWLTPGERMAVNGLLIPFYTWARQNFTRSIAQVIRAPAQVATGYAAIGALPLMWNWMMAAEEEDRLLAIRPDLAGKMHLWLPFLRDEMGNPALLYFEDTLSESLDFLGLNGFMHKAAAGAIHGDPDLLLRDQLLGSVDGARKAFRDWTAPWIRAATNIGYQSRFETVGERGENVMQGLTAFRPAADIEVMFNLSKDRSMQDRLLAPVPFVGFIDLSDAVPVSQRSGQFQAGRIQRREAGLSAAVQESMNRFTSGLLNGNLEQMQAAVDRVWSRVGDSMAEAGMSEIHLWGRMLRSADREIRRRAVIEAGGALPPKFFELSRTQQAELLMRLANR